mmetsp:Transcript_42345/g.128225  ORF Transcript_42345/g.128225 Transcript_42345/m.128225 type:complete len:210 (-) Transcript_42345:693-1322(-)
MPSSTAARVALRASLRRSFTSCTSTSEAPPTLMTATPPESFARRSRSLSRSYSELVASTAAWICSQRASMSPLLPAPSRITVSSLVTVMLFAVPKTLGSKPSLRFRPVSSLMTSPPQRTAMSCSRALRWSPKPGALTAATCRPPRSLFTTSVARASPSMSSAIMRSGCWSLATCSRMGRMDCTEEIFFSCSRMRGFSNSTFCVFVLVTK